MEATEQLKGTRGYARRMFRDCGDAHCVKIAEFEPIWRPCRPGSLGFVAFQDGTRIILERCSKRTKTFETFVAESLEILDIARWLLLLLDNSGIQLHMCLIRSMHP